MTLSSSPTLTFSNGQAGGEYKLILNQDTTGGRTVTWPTSVIWAGGTAPVLSTSGSSTDIASFVYDGSNYLGSYNLKYGSATSIAFDNAASSNDGTFSSQTTPITITSNPNRAVFACVEGTNGSSDNITGVTYIEGGSSANMTLIAHIKGSSSRWTSLWYGLNPDSGTNNIIVSSGSSDIIGTAVASYSGVNQSMKYVPTATDASSTGSFTGTTISQSVTTLQDSSWAILCSHGVAFSAGANTTTRVANIGGYGIADTNGAVHPAGSVTLNSSNSSNWSVDMASFSPAH